jgi:GDSL-like Lipase/Acylhydrolase
MIKNIKWLLFASLTLVACNDDENTMTEEPVSAGSADFSKYVALGDSFAAGFSDGALFKAAQETSYTNILAGLLAQAGGGEFKIPYMNVDAAKGGDVGGLLLGGNPVPNQGVRLFFNGKAPEPVVGTPSTEVTTKLSGSFNNMGIPGAKSFHLIAPGYGNVGGLLTNPRTANPYFVRIARNTTVLADALDQNPSFFSLWIGGNDVLGYALTGGDGSDPITPKATFDFAYDQLISQLTANGRKGVVANLPLVSSLPHFTTVPYNPVPALAPTQSGSLNFIFSEINKLTSGQNRFQTLTTNDGNPSTVEATNPLLIIDETLPDLSSQITSALTPVLGATTAGYLGSIYGKARHAKEVKENGKTIAIDYILLPTQNLITPTPSGGNIQPGAPEPFNIRGVTYPLQDAAVLTIDEVDQIKSATEGYNATIEAAAAAKGLALVDAKSIMAQLTSANGLVVNGYTLKEDFVTGGAFSLDGIHPSPRGYALIANKFAEAINAKYGSTLKSLNIGTYRVLFPKAL